MALPNYKGYNAGMLRVKTWRLALSGIRMAGKRTATVPAHPHWVALFLLCVLGLIGGLTGAPAQAFIPEPPPSIVGDHPAVGRLLVASKAIVDPYFRHAVILLLQHDDKGTLGLIVNRPSTIALTEIFSELQDPATDESEGQSASEPIYFGGPVQPPLFSMLVRTEQARKGKRYLLNGLYLAFGTDEVTESIAQLDPTDRIRVYTGYAGWFPGQLEAEIGRGGWHILPGNVDLVFSKNPESVWERLIKQISGHWT